MCCFRKGQIQLPLSRLTDESSQWAGGPAFERGQSLSDDGLYWALVHISTVELCFPVRGLLLGPVLRNSVLPSTLNC
jgi:hypothetical protein